MPDIAFRTAFLTIAELLGLASGTLIRFDMFEVNPRGAFGPDGWTKIPTRRDCSHDAVLVSVDAADDGTYTVWYREVGSSMVGAFGKEFDAAAIELGMGVRLI